MKLRSSKRTSIIGAGRMTVARYRPRPFSWLFSGRDMVRINGKVITFFNGDAA